ncbi:MAG: pilus assembly protein TadG-related protein [Gemmatimonadales bacterium]
MISRLRPVRPSSISQTGRSRQRPISLATDERGATAAFVAVGLFMMLGMVALAVDLGVLLGARTDSQRVADASALAGAASFITLPYDTDRPRDWAIEYAAKNTVHGSPATVLPEDVDVLLDEQKVRVRVRNITERGNAIRTIFARVLGWDEVNVGTVAAAEASQYIFGVTAGKRRNTSHAPAAHVAQNRVRSRESRAHGRIKSYVPGQRYIVSLVDQRDDLTGAGSLGDQR